MSAALIAAVEAALTSCERGSSDELDADLRLLVLKLDGDVEAFRRMGSARAALYVALLAIKQGVAP